MQAENLIKLSQDIVRKRSIAGITQTEIADAIGVSIGSISRWESTNFSSTKLTDLIKLIRYLEQRGVSFVDYKKALNTYEGLPQTARSVR